MPPENVLTRGFRRRITWLVGRTYMAVRCGKHLSFLFQLATRQAPTSADDTPSSTFSPETVPPSNRTAPAAAYPVPLTTESASKSKAPSDSKHDGQAFVPLNTLPTLPQDPFLSNAPTSSFFFPMVTDAGALDPFFSSFGQIATVGEAKGEAPPMFGSVEWTQAFGEELNLGSDWLQQYLDSSASSSC